VIDTNYRRLVDGRSIDISLGGIHNIVVGSDIDQTYQETVNLEDLSAIMADGTGVKQHKGRKGELRAVIGVTHEGRVEPLGCFANTEWSQIENIVKDRIKKNEQHQLPFVYDGEPGLDTFLSDIAESQRCAWHAPRGLYHALWQDNLKKKDSQPHMDKIKGLIGIELPEYEYELLKDQDKEQVQTRYQSSKAEITELIQTFKDKGYRHGASYLENLADRLFTNIEIWLRTGVIAPKTTSLLERVFREIGRRLKRIAWGWSDKAVTKLSKMIMLKQYSRSKWEQFWMKKLGIEGHFTISISSVELAPCQTF
jgi:transposase-like protein